MYVLTIEVDSTTSTIPTRSEIRFSLPGDATDVQAVNVARGIRKAFRDTYDTRVRLVSFQETGMTRDIALGAA